MAHHKYVSFHTRKEVCEWLDRGIYKAIVSITECDGCFTIFYIEYDEEAFIRDMEAISCDPGFAIPAHDIVRNTKPSPSVRPSTIPEPCTIC